MLQLLVKTIFLTALVVAPAIFAEVVLWFLSHAQGFNDRVAIWIGAGLLIIATIILLLTARVFLHKFRNSKT